MPVKRKKSPVRKFQRPIAAITLIGLLLILLGSGSILTAVHLEGSDAFCASCHTQPETTFFARTQAATPVDLASKHHSKSTRCIDCHSGLGAAGRAVAMQIGAVDLVAFVTGMAKQPAPLTHPIADANCLKCHAAVPSTRDFNRHFHAFLTRWQALDKNAATCVGCHVAHLTDGESRFGFLEQNRTSQVCQSCHQAIRG